MAFNIGSVASNYAASFRPVGPAGGFENVKSDLAADYLMRVPLLRQQMEMQMAREALAEKASIDRTKMNIDGQIELQEMADKRGRRAAALKMLGSDLGPQQDAMTELLNQATTAHNLGVLRDSRQISSGLSSANQNTLELVEKLRNQVNQGVESISTTQSPAVDMTSAQVKSQIDAAVETRLNDMLQKKGK